MVGEHGGEKRIGGSACHSKMSVVVLEKLVRIVMGR